MNDLKRLLDPLIVRRENGLCLICAEEKHIAKSGNDVHEILSKSKFVNSEADICIRPENMVLLCRKHHGIVQGDPEFSGYLLRMLRDKYGYEYSRKLFVWYIENEWPSTDKMGEL